MVYPRQLTTCARTSSRNIKKMIVSAKNTQFTWYPIEKKSRLFRWTAKQSRKKIVQDTIIVLDTVYLPMSVNQHTSVYIIRVNQTFSLVRVGIKWCGHDLTLQTWRLASGWHAPLRL